MSILLNAKDLSHGFAGKVLFKNLQFGVHAGERIGLIGPNGAGKSTLVKILAQKMKADSGQITWRKGLRVAHLMQSPVFDKNAELVSTLMDNCIDQDNMIAKTYEWLAKLDLQRWPEDQKISQLSGGWQKRVALACQMLNEPDLLILDEPTNHLDVETILWLENFIQRLSPSVATLIVTHDRLFLDRVANTIWDLDPKLPQNLMTTTGNYTQHIENKEIFLESERRREKHLQNTLRRETEWLRRGAKARQTKQKARIETAGDLKAEVESLVARNRDTTIGIEFKKSERSPTKLIEFEALSKNYGGKTLFENFSGLITAKTRLCLMGPNGIGKSTLLKVLIGQIEPDSGTVKRAEKLSVSYFEQTRESFDASKSLLKTICPEGDYVQFQGNYMIARTYLERFGFNRDQFEVSVSLLSGGEQARLRMAQLMLKPAQILILDEPTNDLDLSTLEVLEEALSNYDGAVLLVTHDRFFMGQVATEILSFPEMLRFADYFQWESWKEGDLALKELQTLEAENSHKTIKPAKKERLTNKERKELENMESHILSLETKLQSLQTQSASSEVISNASKLQDIYKEISETQALIDAQYARWTELSGKN
jgi:ATP-binding cassette subfamily F protein uup